MQRISDEFSGAFGRQSTLLHKTGEPGIAGLPCTHDRIYSTSCKAS